MERSTASIRLRRRLATESRLMAAMVHAVFTFQLMLVIIELFDGFGGVMVVKTSGLDDRDRFELATVIMACISRMFKIVAYIALLSRRGRRSLCSSLADAICWLALCVADTSMLVLMIAQSPCRSGFCEVAAIFTFTDVFFIALIIGAVLVNLCYAHARSSLCSGYDQVAAKSEEPAPEEPEDPHELEERGGV